MFMEYLPVDPVLSQTSKGRTSFCAARGFENEVQTALQRVLRIRPPHTQQAKREQPWKTPPVTPGSASFHSSVSNKEENRRDTAPIRKQDINTVYQFNDSSHKSSLLPIATLYTLYPSILAVSS